MNDTSLTSLRRAYIQGLHTRRKELTEELRNIDRELNTLQGSGTVAPETWHATRRTDNPTNDQILPVIYNLYGGDHSKCLRLQTIQAHLVQAGVGLKGDKPTDALYQRLKALPNKPFAFVPRKGVMLRPVTVHAGHGVV